MNIWHDIDPLRVTPENFAVVIEIPKGSRMKYEMDKETGLLKLDRVLFTATHYPQNYGFIPRSYGEDNDPLDVLVLCSDAIHPMTLVQCFPIGMIHMVDSGRNDEKIIAVPFGEPTYSESVAIEDLPPHIFAEIIHFFSVYKQLEGKTTSVDPVQGREAAVKAVEKAILSYQWKFTDLQTPLAGIPDAGE